MNILIEGLQKVKENGHGASLLANENQMFSEYYNKWKFGQNYKVELSFKEIPKFYIESSRTDRDEEHLPSILELEARTMLLARMSEGLMDNEELESLRALLNEYSSGSEKKIGYTDLKRVISKTSCQYSSYYSAKVFAQLQRSGDINDADIVPLFTYAMKKTWQKKARIGLSVYDSLGKGYLRESELESFVADLIPDCTQLNSLKEEFYPFYVCTVVRKFMFFLDPMRTGKIQLKDILASNFLDDLLLLKSEEVPEDKDQVNWFSALSALQIYGRYLTLDKDNNGMLSKRELAAYGMGTLTEIFIERVFQEFLTYGGEMDYKSYLEFVLALENRQEQQSLRYYFRVLDINQNGYLDAFSINYFFRGVQEEMKKRQQELVKFEDIKDELFDMVRPVDPLKITFTDLRNSQNAEYFVSILTDLNEFLNYENKEYN